jgi:hypothetical protein
LNAAGNKKDSIQKAAADITTIKTLNFTNVRFVRQELSQNYGASVILISAIPIPNLIRRTRSSC